MLEFIALFYENSVMMNNFAQLWCTLFTKTNVKDSIVLFYFMSTHQFINKKLWVALFCYLGKNSEKTKLWAKNWGIIIDH